GRRGGVADQHLVEAAALVSAGEVAYPGGVYLAPDDVHRGAVVALGPHADHADELDGHRRLLFPEVSAILPLGRRAFKRALRGVLRALELRHGSYVLSRGSRTSRSPSPTRFIASTVSMMASPGKVEIHQASRR